MVAFSRAQQIWLANRDGTAARHFPLAGKQAVPCLSPDGAHLAFIGEDGVSPRSVYVVPIEGGEPRRLTFHSADLGTVLVLGFTGDMLGWTPDGERVIFSSRRSAFAPGVTQLFTVAFGGGPARQLPLGRAAQGSLSPDGSRIAYVPNVKWQPEWKRYRGGQTTEIRIADLSDPRSATVIPRDNSNDFNPIWVKDRIYFLSDRNGPVTLFSYDLGSRAVTQVLQNHGLDFNYASASADAIVLEQVGSLHLYNIHSGQLSRIEIECRDEVPDVRPALVSLAPYLESAQHLTKVKSRISPAGDQAVFGVRGRILTVAGQGSVIADLTQKSSAVERDPAWSPNGRWIAYFSDESGKYELHIREHRGPRPERRIPLGDALGFYHSPSWSPDSSKIIYADQRLNLWYVDVESGSSSLLGANVDAYPDYLNFMPRLAWAWSPNSCWIAYVATLTSHLRAVFLYSVAEARSYQITDGTSDALHVAFDANGEVLYFTASTDAGCKAAWLDMSSLNCLATRSVYAVTLHKRASTAAVDLDEMSRRVYRLPIPPRNYRALFAGTPGVVLLLEGPLIDDQWRMVAGDQEHTMVRANGATGETAVLAERVLQADVSFDGKRILYCQLYDGRRVQWSIGGTDLTTSGDSRKFHRTKYLNFSDAKVLYDPREEWRHIFDQVWRNLRGFFYDPDLHGLAYETTREYYRRFLDGIACRADLDYLLQEMLGNLTVGHLSVTPADDDSFQVPQPNVGLLGADFEIDQDRYRFARIYDGDLFGDGCRGPLCNPGQSISVGEYLIAINGEEVRTSVDLYRYLQNTAGRETELRVGPSRDDSQSRLVRVIPLSDETPLRLFHWQERNRTLVGQLSAGRIAYVQLPDTFVAGYRAFNRYFLAQSDKEALILDVRYGRGGAMADVVLDYLSRERLHFFYTRDGQDISSPMQGIFGPKVLLINEMAGSGSDALPWMFRRKGLGPLIGKRTWGGLVGALSNPNDLLDGGLVSTPNLAFFNPDGAWEIENHGVAPDIEVEDDPSDLTGEKDAQLRKAVEVVMSMLPECAPGSKARRPPFPVYDGLFSTIRRRAPG